MFRCLANRDRLRSVKRSMTSNCCFQVHRLWIETQWSPIRDMVGVEKRDQVTPEISAWNKCPLVDSIVTLMFFLISLEQLEQQWSSWPSFILKDIESVVSVSPTMSLYKIQPLCESLFSSSFEKVVGVCEVTDRLCCPMTIKPNPTLCVPVTAAHIIRLHERFEFLDSDKRGELRLVKLKKITLHSWKHGVHVTLSK